MVKDVISGDSLTIVAFNISTDPVFIQIQDMLDKAFFNNTNLEGLILHFDQGWQYQQNLINPD